MKPLIKPLVKAMLGVMFCCCFLTTLHRYQSTDNSNTPMSASPLPFNSVTNHGFEIHNNVFDLVGVKRDTE